jgi:hypothetical protein
MNKKQTAAIAKYNKALEKYRLGTVARRAKVLALIESCAEEEDIEIEALSDADGDVQETLFGNVEDSDLVPIGTYSDIDLKDELPDGDVSDQTEALDAMIKEAEEEKE